MSLWDTSRETVDYPLNADSTVFDVGGHRGAWSGEIARLYNPNITVFEPVKEFYDALVLRFGDNPKVRARQVGLSDRTYTTTISKHEDGTSLYLSDGDKEEVRLVDILEFDQKLDLISLNCEGEEYPLLSRMMDIGLAGRCQYIQVQFHNCYPGWADLRESLRERLRETHEERYNVPLVWECWQRK